MNAGEARNNDRSFLMLDWVSISRPQELCWRIKLLCCQLKDRETMGLMYTILVPKKDCVDYRTAVRYLYLNHDCTHS